LIADLTTALEYEAIKRIALSRAVGCSVDAMNAVELAGLKAVHQEMNAVTAAEIWRFTIQFECESDIRRNWFR
jgi:hypothetical protein